MSAKSAALGMGVAIGGAAVIGGFVRLIRSVEEFNQAMRSSLAIMGFVSDKLRTDMAQAAFDVARVTKFSAKEVAESYYFLASAGLTAAQSIKLVSTVANFAQAGMFNLSQATELLTDAQVALGMSFKDVEKNATSMKRVGDVLVKANTVANASVQQFSEALTTKAASAARIAGKSIEETVAVLAAFADQGVKGSDAGAAFHIVLRDLTTKAIRNAEAFKKFNVTVFDSAGEIRNMADVVGDLERALDGLSAGQKKATLLTLGFTDKSIAYIQTLLGMSEAIREAESKMRKAGGTMDDVSNKQLTPMKQSWENIKGSVSAAGSKLVPVLDALALWSRGEPVFGPERQLVESLKLEEVLKRNLANLKELDREEAGKRAERFKDKLKMLGAGILELPQVIRDGSARVQKELRDFADKALATKMKAMKAIADALSERLTTPEERFIKTQEKLNEMLRMGAVDAQLYRRAMSDAMGELNKFRRSEDEAWQQFVDHLAKVPALERRQKKKPDMGLDRRGDFRQVDLSLVAMGRRGGGGGARAQVRKVQVEDKEAHLKMDKMNRILVQQAQLGVTV